MVDFMPNATNEQAQALFVAFPQYHMKFEELKYYVGNMIKYTRDEGKTWTYLYLEKEVFGASGKTIASEGIKAHREQKSWNGKRVSHAVIINADFFDPCLNKGKMPQFAPTTIDEITNKRFNNQNMGRTDPIEPFNPDHLITHKAPLTIVRSSQKDIDVDIKIVFNDRFAPTQPTYPSPTMIEDMDSQSTHTWKVHVNKDESLSTIDNRNVLHKIKMIWWEGVRKSHAQFYDFGTSLNLRNEGACVRKHEIKGYIADILTKKGVSPKEQEAFITYWSDLFEDLPGGFIHVRLATPNELKKLLPEMQVSSADVDFKLQRLYFQFTTVSSPTSVNTPEDYLSSLSGEDLGKDVVLDLGGEVLHQDYTMEQTHSDDYNQRFINKYIVA